jgi:hypothetical protein
MNRECVELIGINWECGDENVCVYVPPQTMGTSGTGGVEVDAGPPKPPLPPNWECLREPPPQRLGSRDQARRVNLRVLVVEFVSLEVPPGITGKACSNQDPTCDAPLAVAMTPDSDGYLSFSNLPHAFDGFFVIEAPSIVTSVLFSNRPFYEDEQWEGPSVVTPETQAAIARMGGEEPETELATTILDVYDCDRDAAPGVIYTQEGTSTEHPFYFHSTYPDRDVEVTATVDSLLSSGANRAIGGFSMVEVGYVTFVGTYAETEELVGKVTVQSKLGTMAFGQIFAGYIREL